MQENLENKEIKTRMVYDFRVFMVIGFEILVFLIVTWV
jgi:hypothetical protein